jgi:hypothetical protein
MEALGKRFILTATPYAWLHGVGVAIEIASAGETFGVVRVLGAADDPEFFKLVALAPQDLCELALSRFVASELPVTLEAVLNWQMQISALGHTDASPLYSTFAQQDLPAVPATHGT